MEYINHINYKEGHIILNLMMNHNHPNIIIYGMHNTGKTSLINCIMQYIFKIERNITENSNYHY